MYSIETLLKSGRSELGRILAATRVNPQGDQNARRSRIAQALGLNSSQLICGIGFNRAIEDYETAIHFLGFSSLEALASERNFILVHDRYSKLSVNDILEIYAVLGADPQRFEKWSDLVGTRLTTIEAQLEATINPILIGGYKLEVRGVYENNLASADFVQMRLDPNYAVLRDIAGECANMLNAQAITAAEFLRHPGVTVREKTRMIDSGLIDQQTLDEYFAESGNEESTRELKNALTSTPSADLRRYS